MPRTPTRKHRSLVSACTLALGCGLLTVAGPPTAAANTDDYRTASENFAGSQIALHEGAGPPTAAPARADTTFGHDVSGHQGDIDWAGPPAAGAEFVYVKATEGTGYTNPHYKQQYGGAKAAGMTRGAYHFARPDLSSGRDQANYFIRNGGDWSANGDTLPGALDVEYSPKGDPCYGLAPAAMANWIRDFSSTYANQTGRTPMIYTSTSWWNKCTGGDTSFGRTNPLWIARYATSIGALPAGWSTHAIWQFANSGQLPGDQNYFNGSRNGLGGLANG